MTQDHNAKGGAVVGVCSRMEAWETNLLLNLRLWCEVSHALHQGLNEQRKSLLGESARKKCRALGSFIQKLIANAMRRLACHDLDCSCVGAGDCVFPYLVQSATDSHFNDGALITGLAVEPSKAGQIASLAGQLGLAREKSTTRHLNIQPTPHQMSCDFTRPAKKGIDK